MTRLNNETRKIEEILNDLKIAIKKCNFENAVLLVSGSMYEFLQENLKKEKSIFCSNMIPIEILESYREGTLYWSLCEIKKEKFYCDEVEE